MLSTLVGALGGIGFAVWYGWYTVSRTLPGYEERFERQNVSSNLLISQVVQQFRDESREVRHEHRDQLQQFWMAQKAEAMARHNDSDLLEKSLQKLVQTIEGAKRTVEDSALTARHEGVGYRVAEAFTKDQERDAAAQDKLIDKLGEKKDS